MPEPIAFRAALPSTGTALRVAGGEAFLTVAVPMDEKKVLTDAWDRLEECVFWVTLVPETDVPGLKVGGDRKRGRKRRKSSVEAP